MNSEDLKRFGLLAELLDEDRDALLDLLEPEKIRKGRSVYRETAEADAMLLIASSWEITVRCNSSSIWSRRSASALSISSQ